MIGGTSIGAFVAGLYAREADLLSSIGRAKQFSGRMGNIWRIISDVTYPIVAYTTVRCSSCTLVFCPLCLLLGTRVQSSHLQGMHQDDHSISAF